MAEIKMKLTFEEWKKSQKCKCCNRPVSLELKDWGVNTHKIRDIDGQKVKGYYCSDCVDESMAHLMNERFVEVYNGNTIFCKDGNYTPYWECAYYFKTLEDCRNRIDAKHIAVMPFGITPW
ncbi:hypothetical protein [Bacillus subtilis]|uniref:hypothetical protein n=1 Tax=Bacillus subtilis TaxID=1423 RepID=UPI002DB7D729|nr:hypothetical protein [Bacillus subtilis]MEC2335184.1 hypothetical protein [Bacillus subtilis]